MTSQLAKLCASVGAKATYTGSLKIGIVCSVLDMEPLDNNSKK